MLRPTTKGVCEKNWLAGKEARSRIAGSSRKHKASGETPKARTTRGLKLPPGERQTKTRSERLAAPRNQEPQRRWREKMSRDLRTHLLRVKNRGMDWRSIANLLFGRSFPGTWSMGSFPWARRAPRGKTGPIATFPKQPLPKRMEVAGAGWNGPQLRESWGVE